jgi:hypothetical protein
MKEAIPTAPLSYEEARERVLRYYFLGTPCSHGHICARYVKSRACYDCNMERSTKWRAANPERVIALNRKHVANRSPTYITWRAMLNRCYNPNADQWDRYGARGIAVCDRWKVSFDSFLLDVGERPSKYHSIDRYPNRDGNYEPGNVRWATGIEQQNNRAVNHRIVYRGQLMTIAQARHLNGDVIPKTTVLDRLSRGWTPEAAIETIPVMGTNQWS